uniref:phosphatidylinositol-3,5-bisphosphate 3-phosphatase n=1 Tax=Caenorhabditis tropicalis TaxID=1561998 RepID=A0A1I7T965_9PELO
MDIPGAVPGAIDIVGGRRGERVDSDNMDMSIMSIIASPPVGGSYVDVKFEHGAEPAGPSDTAKATIHEENYIFGKSAPIPPMQSLQEESENLNSPSSTEISLLPGEERATLQGGSSEWPIDGGTIFLTNYRVVVAINNDDGTKRFLIFPLQEIEQVDFSPIEVINLHMKGGRVIGIAFPEKSTDAPLLHKLIHTAFQRLNRPISTLYSTRPQEWTSNHTDNPMQSLNVFAWKFSEAVDRLDREGKLPPWLKRADSIANEITHIDFHRLGMSEHFQISSVNEDFKVCATYPEKIIVPKGISDEDIRNGAPYRSIGRFPAIVWRCRKTRAVLMRSSQPQVGILSWRNVTDEKIIEEAVKSSRIEGEEKKQFIIMDARGYTSAFANRARSGGYENSENYQQAKMEFLGLPNIHTVRGSFANIRNMLHNLGPNEQLLQTLQSTGWLNNLSHLLVSSANCAEHLSRGHTVLVHCSDGWDRTTQVTTLAKIMLDEHYRTIEGFEQLIRRDWIAFGHKLYDRQQIGVFNWGDSGERSPIFLQFLEAVRHLHREQPTAFQFSHAYLIKLAKHAYSGLFGSFIFNSHKERRETMNKWNGTLVEIWRFIGAHNEEYVNQTYDEKYVGPLKPINLSVINLRVWHEVLADECERYTLIYNNKEDRPSSGCTTPMASSSSNNLVKSKSSESINSLNVDGSLKDTPHHGHSVCSSSPSVEPTHTMSTSFHQPSMNQSTIVGVDAIDSDGLIRFEDDEQAMLRKKNKAREEAIRLRDEQIDELRKRALLEKSQSSVGKSHSYSESDIESTDHLERAMSDVSMVDSRELPNFRPNTTWEAESKDCGICRKEFNKMSVYQEDRQHHCRNCGKVVCEDCSKHRFAVVEEGQSVQKRVCNRCYDSMHEPKINRGSTTSTSSSSISSTDPKVISNPIHVNYDRNFPNEEEAESPKKKAKGPKKFLKGMFSCKKSNSDQKSNDPSLPQMSLFSPNVKLASIAEVHDPSEVQEDNISQGLPPQNEW